MLFVRDTISRLCQACNLLTFAMLAGYSFLRFKCSPEKSAAEKPKVGCFWPSSWAVWVDWQKRTRSLHLMHYFCSSFLGGQHILEVLVFFV